MAMASPLRASGPGIGADGREHRKRRAVALVAQQRRRRKLLEAGLHVDAERDEAAPLPAVEHRDRRRDPNAPGDDRDAAIQPEDRLGQEADVELIAARRLRCRAGPEAKCSAAASSGKPVPATPAA